MRRTNTMLGRVLAVVVVLASCSGSPSLPQGNPVPPSRPTTLPETSTSTSTSTVPSSTLASDSTTAPPGSTPSSTEPVETTTWPTRGACEPLEDLGEVTAPAAVTGGPWPRPEATTEVVAAVPPEAAGRTVHLGFDTEGDPSPLVDLLDVLDAHQVKSTFFVLGQWVEQNPELLVEIVERGHEIANHAFEHEPTGDMTGPEIIDQLTRTEALVAETAGISTMPYFRPPFGSRTDDSVRVAAEAGWSTIFWTGGANDFVAEATVDSMCADLVYHSYPGAIVLAHTFNPEIPVVIDRYLRQMARDGLVVVPLSVLLADDPEQFLVVDADG